MRKLENIPNTDPPDSNYKKGRIRNKTGLVIGTPIIEQLYGDIVEFIHKLVSISGITENDLPDNETNGHQVFEAFGKSLSSVFNFKYENLILYKILDDSFISSTDVSITYLNETDFVIAYTTPTNTYIQTFRFNGSTILTVGNQLPLGGSQAIQDIASLSDSRIALVIVGIAGEKLTTYDFDGTDWSATGNSFTLDPSTTGVHNYSCCKLNSSDIAITKGNDAGNEYLRTYTFDGTDWTLKGNSFSLSAGFSFSVKDLDENEICLVGDAYGTLQKYIFDGVDWSTSGSATAITGGSGNIARLCSLNKSDILYFDENIDRVDQFRFDGTDWNKLNFSYDITDFTNDIKFTQLPNGLIICVTDDLKLMVFLRTLIFK